MLAGCRNRNEAQYIEATKTAGFELVKSQPIRLGSGCTGIHGKSGCPVPYGEEHADCGVAALLDR